MTTRAAAFARDGHALIRGLVPRADIERWRPVLRRVVDTVSSSADAQRRIDDYSKLFTQVTNVWRIDDEARGIV